MKTEKLIEGYDALLRLFGLCRYHRYAVTKFHLQQMRTTESQRSLDDAWEAFHRFANGMNRQMEVIEKQKTIYFCGRCYRLERDKSCDGSPRENLIIPENYLKKHLLLKFKRWVSRYDEDNERGASA